MNTKKIIGLSFLALLTVGCGSKKDTTPAPPSVTVAKPISEEITTYLIETGNTVAYNSVDLVARVSGYLDSYLFTDGSIVEKDSLLFVIQPQPYADQLKEAQATLDSNTAAYTYDAAEYARQEKMYKKHATSLANVQQWLSTRDQAAAAVESATASLDNAKITYGYTQVTAPFTGRIGRHLIDPGNVVGNGEATKLASIQQLDPIYVYFTINELDLLKLRQLAHDAGFNPEDIAQIPIEVALQNETGFPHKGHLDFVSSELEASTGTIQLRGILDNKDYQLLPGLFVQARIAIGKATTQLTIPSTAVLYDQIGSYVFTVGNENKVSQTRITVGETKDDRVAITKGLDAQDKVIVEGLQNASAGATVSPEVQA